MWFYRGGHMSPPPQYIGSDIPQTLAKRVSDFCGKYSVYRPEITYDTDAAQIVSNGVKNHYITRCIMKWREQIAYVNRLIFKSDESKTQDEIDSDVRGFYWVEFDGENYDLPLLREGHRRYDGFERTRFYGCKKIEARFPVNVRDKLTFEQEVDFFSSVCDSMAILPFTDDLNILGGEWMVYDDKQNIHIEIYYKDDIGADDLILNAMKTFLRGFESIISFQIALPEKKERKTYHQSRQGFHTNPRRGGKKSQ
jgi:hypothetical protein